MEIKRDGEWLDVENLTELVRLASQDHGIWEAVADPGQNEWPFVLDQLRSDGETKRVELLSQLFDEPPKGNWPIMAAVMEAQAEDLDSDGMQEFLRTAKSAMDMQAQVDKLKRISEWFDPAAGNVPFHSFRTDVDASRYWTKVWERLDSVLTISEFSAKKEDPKGIVSMLDSSEKDGNETANENTTNLEVGTCWDFILPGGTTVEMIYCPPGSFLMGADEYDRNKKHRVTLTKGFWLGRYQVTQEQWRSVMGDEPSFFRGDRNPVENVSWDDCQKFIAKINDELNCRARLPTEAEWEYACRARCSGIYGGMGELRDMAWYDQNSSGCTHPVGQKQANAWGLFDMHGNVFEWCNDWLDLSLKGDTTDPTGPATGECRVFRGGSWKYSAIPCQCAYRSWHDSDHRSSSVGFRLCCSV